MRWRSTGRGGRGAATLQATCDPACASWRKLSCLLSGGYDFTEERADVRGVGEYGVPREPQALERALPRCLVPGPARVLYNHWYVAKVGTVAYRRLDPDLRGDPADRERIHAQVTQGHVEEGSLEGAHGDLVGDRFARQWGELWHDLGLRGLRGERRHHPLYLIDALPGHGLPELRGAHELFRKRRVAAEEHAEAPLPSRRQNLPDSGGDLGAVGQLAGDADLHVVDE